MPTTDKLMHIHVGANALIYVFNGLLRNEPKASIASEAIR